jgi:hypothetical protein
MNSRSSRSHAFFEIIGEEEAIFIDLAGKKPPMMAGSISKNGNRGRSSSADTNNSIRITADSSFVNKSLLQLGMGFNHLVKGFDNMKAGSDGIFSIVEATMAQR